ncbi:MAG: TonB-dependent receptor [Bacteroides sp.]|nr:TonB-dependent receptor [Bacteroides sp.]
MLRIRTLLLSIILFSALFGHASTHSSEPESADPTRGSISGKVVDQKTGETIIGANVIIEGTIIGAATDLNGNFRIENLSPGTYNIQVSFISYEPVIIEGVLVEATKNARLNVVLVEREMNIEGVQVTARRVTHTEMSLITSIRTSNLVVSGISAQQISRSQDSDAAAVIKRIPGVTLVDNRFIMVRGLSERYNASMLHETYAPSMETDVRSFSFDIIPSNLVDRIMIYKSPSADLPGDFAGGVIRVYTKSIPDENGLQVSYSGGYDPEASFREFQSQNNGKWHWLGFNDNTHSLPDGFPENLRAIANNQQAINQAGQALSNNWVPESSTSNLNHSLHISGGYSFNLGRVKIGNISAVSYNNSRSVDNVDRADFNAYDLEMERKSFIYSFNDEKNAQNIRTSLMHNWSAQLGKGHTIELKNQFYQLSNSEYVLRTGPHYDFNFNASNHSFQQIYRGLYSGQLTGSHEFLEGKTTMNWTAGYGYSFREEPDYRRYRSDLDTITGHTTLYVPFGAAAAYFLGRFYSEMEENNLTASLNLTHRLSFDRFPGFVPEFSAGFFYEDKDRFFNSRNLGYVRANTMQFDQNLLDSSIDYLFQPENINTSTGIKIDEQTNPSDSYTAFNTLKAGYAMLTLPLSQKIKLISGLRVENNRQSMHSFSLSNQPIDVIYPVTSWLPSANLTYNFNSKMLVRAAYGKTLNRPEFRELAPFGFYDFSFNLVKKGNEYLQTAYIHNADVRWEYYPSAGESISFGMFYKYFINPIESKFIDGGGSGGIKTFSYENAESAISQGVETEIRKSLEGFTGIPFIDDLSILFNAAVIKSNVTLGKAGEGQQVTDRSMQGQSPFIVNAGLYYRNEKHDLMVNLLYNIVGQRIFIIGYHSYPDIYEMPRNQIDLTISKSIGNRLDFKFGVRDMLNQPIVLMQDANQDGIFDMEKDQVIQKFQPGARFSLGISYKL